MKYDWLHYDISKDAIFCYLYMQADHQNNFLSSKKCEPAFIKTGFMYRKEAILSYVLTELSQWTSRACP